MSPFKDNMKRLREAKGLSQEALARLVNVSYRTISRWESGGSSPDVPLLVGLAGALGCTVADLTGEAPHESYGEAG